MLVTFIVRWSPRPELRDKFLEITGRLGVLFTPEIASAIDFMRPSFNRKGQFVVLESWKDHETLDQLRRSTLFHDAIRDLSACCDMPLEIEYLDPLDGDATCIERFPPGKANPRLYPVLGTMTPVIL